MSNSDFYTRTTSNSDVIEEMYSKLSFDINEIKPFVINEFLHKHLVGEQVDKNSELYFFHKLNLNIPHPNYCIIAFKLFFNHVTLSLNNLKEKQFHHFFENIYEYIRNTSDFPFWVYRTSISNAFIIFNVVSASAELYSYCTKIHDWIYKEYPLQSSWGISTIFQNLNTLMQYVHEATRTADLAEYEHIIDYSSVCPSGEIPFYPKCLEELLIQSIKTENHTLLDFSFKMLKNENFLIRNINRHGLSNLNTLLINTICKLDQPSTPLDEYYIALNEIMRTYTGNYNEYFFVASQIFHQICSITNCNKKSSHKTALINKITSYIEDNYNDPNISLSKISDQFKLSEGYISSLFKEKTGIKLTDYIENIRIRSACRMLNESRHSINTIAILVGYSNVYSFRRAFKRKLSLSPRDFRNRNETLTNSARKHNCNSE